MEPTKLGLTLSSFLLILGLWTFAAPFIVGSQTQGGPWSTPTLANLWTGGFLVLAMATGLSLVTTSELRRLLRASRSPISPPPPQRGRHDV